MKVKPLTIRQKACESIANYSIITLIKKLERQVYFK